MYAMMDAVFKRVYLHTAGYTSQFRGPNEHVQRRSSGQIITTVKRFQRVHCTTTPHCCVLLYILYL